MKLLYLCWKWSLLNFYLIFDQYLTYQNWYIIQNFIFNLFLHIFQIYFILSHLVFYKYQMINKGKRQFLRVQYHFIALFTIENKSNFFIIIQFCIIYHHSTTVTSQCSLRNIRERGVLCTSILIPRLGYC